MTTQRLAPSPTLRILLVDRSRLLADVVARRLITEDDVISVGVASSGAEALRMLAEQSFAVVVATPDLARELRAVPQRRSDVSTIPIIILAGPDDPKQAPDLLRIGGIAGWVSRDRSAEDLMEAVRTCQRGDVCIPMSILNLLAEHRLSEDAPQSARDRVLGLLTEREVEVFLLLEQGLGRAEIATTLHLSPNTVRTHVQRILRRLNVHSTLAALALLRV
jgi:DNA-binding NarL/FixJ family response regulator